MLGAMEFLSFPLVSYVLSEVFNIFWSRMEAIFSYLYSILETDQWVKYRENNGKIVTK